MHDDDTTPTHEQCTDVLAAITAAHEAVMSR